MRSAEVTDTVTVTVVLLARVFNTVSTERRGGTGGVVAAMDLHAVHHCWVTLMSANSAPLTPTLD